MKPKQNYQSNPSRVNAIDRCQTPPYAVKPLLPYLQGKGTIWEPAAGEGLLVNALRQQGLTVVAGDILTGQNFFAGQPDAFDLIVTNPPYGTKYHWLARCFELNVPFALLVPVETIGATQAQKMMERYGFEIMLLNKRVNFKMPNAGYSGGGAQFPVLWFCHHILPEPIVFGHIEYSSPSMITLSMFAEGSF